MGRLDPKTETKIRTLVESGRKIEGVKLYREATGAGLKEASDAVNAIEAAMTSTRPDLKWGSDWLPPRCPGCGAGVSPDEVSWIDEFASAAKCGFCGTVMRDPGE